MRYYDMETIYGYPESMYGFLPKPDDTWGYRLYYLGASMDETFEVERTCLGYGSEEEAEEAAFRYLDDEYGEGNWTM